MYSPKVRLISINSRQKRSTKLSAFLLIIVITFFSILVFTTKFTFHPNNHLAYKLGNNSRTINKSRVQNYEIDDIPFLLDNHLEDNNHSFEQLVDQNDLNFKDMCLPSVNDTDTRPWYLTNGCRRPNPLDESKKVLWPEQSSDPYEDRIVNQLMYVPFNYTPDLKPLKNIFLCSNDNDWKLSLGRREFLKCPVSSCQLVPRAKSKSADLIFFKSCEGYTKYERERPHHQIWAKFEIESAENIQMVAPPQSINWTVTYRYDSEIPVPYYKFYPLKKSPMIANKRNYAANKTRKVAWFVSNCWANNVRLEYARELAKHIQLDIYGICGTYECPRSNESECWRLLNNEYKFYLSFENSNCLDYITEKFWLNGLMQDILPIVMGAHPSTYKRLAPPHSYIHVDDYESPKQLAQYLKLLDSNDELYNKYFEWKGTGYIKQIFMWCRICAMLHAPSRLTTHSSYLDVNDWWNSRDVCVPITWTNMSVPITQKPLLNQTDLITDLIKTNQTNKVTLK